MKTTTKSNNLEEIITVTTKAVVAALVEQGVIIPAREMAPKPKKATKKPASKVTKVTKEGNKKTSESKSNVRYCHRNEKGNLVISKKPTSKKVTKKATGWQYIKNADGTVTVKKS